MSNYTILIVDDEPTQCKVLGKFIKGLGYNCFTMSSGMEVVDFFVNKKVIYGISCNDVDIVLLDLSMPDLDGLAVLKQIAPIKRDTQIVVLTANKDSNTAVTAINYGAIDYVVKGDRDMLTRITTAIGNAIEKKNLKYQVSHLVRKSRDQVSFVDVIGQSESISNVIKLAKKVANSAIPILIQGPSGSGKELLARAIHGSSSRSGKPFVVANCDMLKSGNVEEEIFGSERLLPNALTKNIGKLREANNGTILFQKIDILEPAIQTKILHFVQDGCFVPFYGKEPVFVNVRIIVSANSDLEKLVVAKKFREDLFYRLSSFKIDVPSLKERGDEDIKLLAESFCRDFSVNENKKIKTITQEAMYLLCNYDWEDNVRQLKNSIFRAVTLCDSDNIEPKHFPYLLKKEGNIFAKSKSAIKRNAGINTQLIDIFDDEGNCKTMVTIEDEIIKRLVDVSNGNVSEVAKQLDVGRSTVYRKIKSPEDDYKQD